MTEHRLYCLLVLLILATVAGCVQIEQTEPELGQSKTEVKSDAPSESDPVRCRSAAANLSCAEFSHNPRVVWQRVQRQLGTNVAPPRVVVRDIDTAGRYESGVVYVDPSYTSVSASDTLAHEFAHHILETTNPWPGRYYENADEAMAVQAKNEGVATYVEYWYQERYLSERSELESLPTRSPEWRWYLGQYLLGHEYVDYQLDQGADPNDVVSARWPNTTEQVLHPSRATEPPLALTVRAARANREGYARYLPLPPEGRFGELAVRISLWTRLNATRAARGAAGWGNDRLVVFQGPDGEGYAWTIRYDDPNEAREARAAFRAYGEEPGRPFPAPPEFVTSEAPSERFVDGFWRAPTNRSIATTLVGEETVVVFAGPESFVANATATGTAGNVTVGTNATAT